MNSLTFFKAALTASIVLTAGTVLWLALTQDNAFLINNLGPILLGPILIVALAINNLWPGIVNTNHIAIKQKRLVFVKKKGMQPDHLGIRPLYAGICLLMFPTGVMMQLVALTMKESHATLFGVLEATGMALLVGGLALYIVAETRIYRHNKRNGLNQ